MWSSNRTISAGDTVIVWMTRDNLEPMVITPNAILHNKFGIFPHNSFLGLPYGSKVRSSAPSNSGGRRGDNNANGNGGGGGGGFLYVLRPTPELWTLALPHRTQILYIADISFVVSHLNIGPGKRVVEAGTGSGSFSHSVARSVGRGGRLFTFEFHEQRAVKAREEFEKHGLSVPIGKEGGGGEDGQGEGGGGVVKLQHRNVCKDGFGVDLEEREEVDAVFLDLPAPWEAVPWARKVMRKDRVSRICCFSPCIEQVIRTVTALNDAGFSEITMFETLLRPIDVSSTPTLPSINDVTARLKAAEVKREDKRLRQIAANREREAKEAFEKALENAKNEGGEVPSSSAGKRKQGEGGEGEDKGEEEEGVEKKRVKITDGEEEMQVDGGVPPIPVISTTQITLSHVLASSSSSTPTPTPTPRAGLGTTAAKSTTTTTTTTGPPTKISVSKALPEVRGHTSYLTFATLVPYAYAQKLRSKTGLGVNEQEEGKEKERGVGEGEGKGRGEGGDGAATEGKETASV